MKRAIQDYLKDDNTFRTLVNLFDFLNSLNRCIPILIPHLDETYCKFSNEKLYSLF